MQRIEQAHRPTSKQKGFCPYCYRDVKVTSNGKCQRCGAKLLTTIRHSPTLRKIELFLEQNPDGTELIPLEINHKLYFIPVDILKSYNDTADNMSKVTFVDHIKTTCKSFSL